MSLITSSILNLEYPRSPTAGHVFEVLFEELMINQQFGRGLINTSLFNFDPGGHNPLTDPQPLSDAVNPITPENLAD